MALKKKHRKEARKAAKAQEMNAPKEEEEMENNNKKKVITALVEMEPTEKNTGYSTIVAMGWTRQWQLR